MIRFLGLVFVVLVIFTLFGLVVDWVEITKHNEQDKVELNIVVNHGKIKTDVTDCCNSIGNLFKSNP